MDRNREPLRKIPTTHATPLAADIGSPLKAARTAKGYSLESVSEQTRIPRKFLAALEDNQFEDFPALVYLRGFLKGYCEFLDVDFEPLWNLVQGNDAAAAPAPAAPPAAKAKPAKKGKAEPAAPAAPASPPPPQTPSPPHKIGEVTHKNAQATSSSGIGAIVFAALLAAGLAFWTRRPRPPAAAKPPSVGPAALAPLSAPTPAQLTIIFEKDAWISLRADGEMLFEGRVPQGRRQEWRARKGWVLRTSDPKSLSLLLNATAYQLNKPDESGDYHLE